MSWFLRRWNPWSKLSRIDVSPAPPSRHEPADVPGEYRPFYEYLAHRYATTVVLSFRDIEALLGFALPTAARTDRDWWTRAGSGACRHSVAWAAARRTATPNLAAQTVTFDRGAGEEAGAQ